MDALPRACLRVLIRSNDPHRCEPRQLDAERRLHRTRHDPHGKKQPVVETRTSIEKGTSVLVAHHVRSDFTAETASFGCRPDVCGTWLTYLHHAGPRHPASVGAPHGSDFPAALVRLCQSLVRLCAHLRSTSPTTQWVCREIPSHAHESCV